MSWFSWTDAIKKRACRYVLQRYLGQFIQEKLSLDQLSLDLSSSSGNAEITDVCLDVKGLNELSETNHWPILFVDGYIGSIELEVPWSKLLVENSHVRVSRLMLTVQPKSWSDELSLIESMYSSMMSSKQMAEEIFKEANPGPDKQFLSGLEQFAVAIDTIFNRVIVTFEDTTLRVEHLVHDNREHVWTALEVQISRLEYFDTLANSAKELLEEQASHSTKKVVVSDVRLLIDRFNDSKRNGLNSMQMCTALCNTSPEIASNPILFAYLKGDQEVEVNVEHGDSDPSPKLGIHVCLSELPILIEPRQMLILCSLIKSFLGAAGTDNLAHESPCKALSSIDFAVMEQDLQGLVLQQNKPAALSDPPLGGMILNNWAGEVDDESDHYLPMSTSSQATSLTVSAHNTSNMSIHTEFTFKCGIVFMVILEDSHNSSQKCAQFFREIDGVPLRDVVTVTTAEFLPFKHLRVALYPVTLTGRTKTSALQRGLEVAVTVANAYIGQSNMDWIECLLVSQMKTECIKEQGPPLPFLRLKVNHTYSNSVSFCKPEVTNASCSFGVIHCKYDRLLESRLVEMFSTQPNSNNGRFHEEHSSKAHDINLNLTCPQLSCELRFQALEVANVEKKLRPDALIITLQKITVAGKISNDASNDIKILFQSGFADYRPTAEAKTVQLARVFSDPKVEDDGCGSASIVIQVNSTEKANLLGEGLDSIHPSVFPSMRTMNDMTKSTYGKFTEEGPFLTRRVMYDKERGSSEEVILAGDRKQMQSFFEGCSSNSKLVVDIVLPIVIVEFANRELFEIIYNRLLTDLLYTPNYDCQQFVHVDTAFEECRSYFESIQERSYVNDKFFYSSEEESLRAIKPVKQNLLCLGMSVGEASIVFGSGKEREFYAFQMCPQLLQFYLVSNYQGDPNVSFVLLHSMDAQLRHNPKMKVPLETHEELTSEMLSSMANTREVLNRIDKSTFGKFRTSIPQQEVVCLVVKIQCEPSVKLKNVTLAVSVADTSWRHVVEPSRQFWITQLIDFFNVKDFPVAGHIPSSVITELHFSLEKSIIDYRPLHLPYCCLLSVENFSLSSNITPKATTSTLRLILEDTSIFISSHNDQLRPPNLLQDYVCVLNAGLLDLCLVMSEQRVSSPAITFHASNDIIHIRTCSDSLYALQCLVQYLAADGDLVAAQNDVRKESASPAATGQPLPLVNNTLKDFAEMSSLDVNEMMEDALSESFSERSPESSSSSQRSFSTERATIAREQSPADMKVYYNTKDDDFLVLEDLPGSGIVKHKGQENIRVLGGDSIYFVEDFLKVPTGKTDQLRAPSGYPDPVESYTLQEMTLVWHIYGGNDFGEAKQVNARSGQLSCLGGAGRRIDQTMELTMSKIRFRHDLYPPESGKSSRQCLLIRDIQIKDKLASSGMNKFLYQFSTDSLPRQSHANMLTLKMCHVAPENECSIFLSIKPLRLNVDQDTLIFLYQFFQELTGMAYRGQDPAPPPPSSGQPSSSASSPPTVYIRSFVFTPDVPIRIDYHGKHVALDQGAIAGLLMGIGQLTCLEVKLKKLCNKHGLLGFDRLVQFALAEWLSDIKKRQVQNVIGGVGPMHSIVQLISGVRDLFWLPVEQYRKDGQIVRGLQRGTHSFTTNAAIAFLELTGRAIGTIQHAAELAYNLLSPSVHIPIAQGIPGSAQPVDIREGVHNAYLVMANGINDTARNFVQAASNDNKAKGVSGAVGEVLRQIPPAMVRPIIDVTVATSNVINGVKYQLAPESRQEDSDKWKNSKAKHKHVERS